LRLRRRDRRATAHGLVGTAGLELHAPKPRRSSSRLRRRRSPRRCRARYPASRRRLPVVLGDRVVPRERGSASTGALRPGKAKRPGRPVVSGLGLRVEELDLRSRRPALLGNRDPHMRSSGRRGLRRASSRPAAAQPPARTRVTVVVEACVPARHLQVGSPPSSLSWATLPRAPNLVRSSEIVQSRAGIAPPSSVVRMEARSSEELRVSDVGQCLGSTSQFAIVVAC